MLIRSTALSEHTGSCVLSDKAEVLSAEGGAQIRDLLRQRGVLVFKRLALSNTEQVQLAGNIGDIREEGENGIFKVTLNKRNNAPANYLKGSFQWHMDGTHDSVPVFGSLLTGVKLSEVGGQTEFANSYAAYEALSEQQKRDYESLKIVHSVETSMRNAGIEASPENLAFWRSIPDRVHRLVWTHEDGRKSLVIGCHADRVEGMEASASKALIAQLLEWVTQPRFVYRHEWDVGDLLIWDNTGVLHRAEPYAEDSGREMHRTTLLGEEAFS